MRRLLFAGFAPLFAAAAVAQTPPVAPPAAKPVQQLFPTHPAMDPSRVAPSPVPSAQPNTVIYAPPPGQTPTQPGEPGKLPTTLVPEVTLPQKEVVGRIDANSMSVRRQNERWVVMNGLTTVRDFGSSREEADEFVKVLRELRPTDWGTVGTSRVVVEYALTNGVAATPSFSPKTSVTVDLGSVRVEQVRGVHVVRDDQNILLNFGQAKEDAEQALAVIRKYKFNRLGQVGAVGVGATFLFAQELPATNKAQAPKTQLNGAYAQLAAAMEESKLARTGIEVTGGVAGEKFSIDPKSVELKRDKADWKLVHGADVIANFGASEWTGRDALKLVQDHRFTEFCRFNADVSFFLVNGQAPTRVPFAVQATRFDRDNLTIKTASGAAETVPYLMVTNLARTLGELKERGLTVVGTADDAEHTLYEADLTGPVALVLGAEGPGMRQLTRKTCDVLVGIPMLGAVESLNVSVATGVCLYEARRQRGG